MLLLTDEPLQPTDNFDLHSINNQIFVFIKASLLLKNRLITDYYANINERLKIENNLTCHAEAYSIPAPFIAFDWQS